MKRLSRNRVAILFLVALVIVMNIFVVSMAKDKDALEEKLVDKFNFEFNEKSDNNNGMQNQRATKIEKRISVKNLVLSNDAFVLEDSKEKLEYVFILDENNEAVGLSAMIEDQMISMSDGEAKELYDLYTSFDDVYRDEKKIQVYAIPGFFKFSLAVELTDGSIDVWPSFEMNNAVLKGVEIKPYTQYSLDEFIGLVNEQRLINDRRKRDNPGEIVY